MHKNKIIHRDLKLGNLFISENMDIKIGDFGLATTIQFEGERKHTICGTPNYIAPEILEGKSVGHSYEVDYWAIGVIIYTLIIGRPPFETEDVKETYKRIQENNFSFPKHIYISDEAKDLIEKILVMNPTDRLNIEGMRNHPFMNNVKIPKSIPQYTVNFPPNSIFYRKLNDKNIKCISDISTCNDSTENHFEKLIQFSKKNLNNINRKNLVKDQDIFDQNNNMVSVINSSLNKLKNTDKNIFINKSQCKETHKIVNHKISKIDISNIFYITDIIDYSKEFGIIYKTNKQIIGIYFNDKSNIFKEFESKDFQFLNKRLKLNKNQIKSFNIDKKVDIPTDIKNKCEILLKFQKYLQNSVKYI